MRASALVPLALTLSIASAGAQLTAGDRVRILHGSTGHFVSTEASFVSSTADSVTLRDDSTRSTFALARDSVLQVERWSVVGHHALRGAGVGTITGVAIGAGAGALSTPCPAQGECWKGFAAMAGSVVGAVVGLVSGTFIGAVSRHEEWMLVALPPRSP